MLALVSAASPACLPQLKPHISALNMGRSILRLEGTEVPQLNILKQK